MDYITADKKKSESKPKRKRKNRMQNYKNYKIKEHIRKEEVGYCLSQAWN